MTIIGIPKGNRVRVVSTAISSDLSLRQIFYILFRMAPSFSLVDIFYLTCSIFLFFFSRYDQIFVETRQTLRIPCCTDLGFVSVVFR